MKAADCLILVLIERIKMDYIDDIDTEMRNNECQCVEMAWRCKNERSEKNERYLVRNK